MRFVAAGLLVYLWASAKKERQPTARQWLSAFLLAFLIFVVDYGILFWAEQRVPSGIAAVILATIPAFMALSEIVILRTQRLTVRLSVALLSGIAGVAVLMSHSINLGKLGKSGRSADRYSRSGRPGHRRHQLVDRIGAGAQTAAAFVEGDELGRADACRRSHARGHFCRAWRMARIRSAWPSQAAAWIALVYLVFAGSIAGFTAYVWLLHHESPTKVGTYAYVNPVVAVIIGYFLGGEPLGARTVLGGIFVLASVVTITSMRAKTPAVAEDAE